MGTFHFRQFQPLSGVRYSCGEWPGAAEPATDAPLRRITNSLADAEYSREADPAVQCTGIAGVAHTPASTVSAAYSAKSLGSRPSARRTPSVVAQFRPSSRVPKR